MINTEIILILSRNNWNIKNISVFFSFLWLGKKFSIPPSKCVYADFLCVSHFTSFLTPQNFSCQVNSRWAGECVSLSPSVSVLLRSQTICLDVTVKNKPELCRDKRVFECVWERKRAAVRNGEAVVELSFIK